MHPQSTGLYRGLCMAVLLFASGAAQAGLTLGWDYQQADTRIGQNGVQVMFDIGVTEWNATEKLWTTAASVVDPEVGAADAELLIWEVMDSPDVCTIDIATTAEVTVYEDAGGLVSYARGYTYFQLEVWVTDQPYLIDLEWVLIEATDDFVTQSEHFVNRYGSGDVLYPRVDPYALIWGGLDYTATGYDTAGWGQLSTSASTTLSLTLTQIPEPTGVLLLGPCLLGWLTRRR